ncbi:DUF4227 family protein [Sporolactobacillus laevolacticus]|uniref:Membrane protein n=1 Tax=Sporolactobacillus laevolacticus DSM 442 TaxID=1395513 RepID=V6IWK6_9BACL|nr:DUF4227 family protein [Sporolactobacillus laevolacticus]EST11673.1 membrane protein [Sporolactobacillus laevolacticus DSM 442]
MNDYIRIGIEFFRVLILFAVLTAAFYLGMTWMDHYQERVHRYDEPGSGAVKVSQVSDGHEGLYSWNGHDVSRLFEFLRDGE